MTLHATKGLEFKTIILTNLAEKRFPSEKVSSDLLPPEIIPELKSNIPKNEDIKEFVRKYESHHQLLEERRLCYVAFTRAKEKLFLTYAKEYSSKKHAPSRFLQEINYLENPIISLTKDEQILWAEPETKIQLGSDMEEKSNIKKLQFSPSALLTFSRCQKEFEFRFIFNMPDRHLTSWEEIQLGSFVHLVLEKGVNLNYSTLTQFLLLAKELQENPEWEKIDFREVHVYPKNFSSTT
jgi:ATP-dependent exoDNAse (exonuclease V) beta subunit